MKPLKHAQISAKKHGGKWEDYIKIHEFFDWTKEHVADMRHRAILHNSFGIFLCAKMFGEVITNSDGQLISVRDIGEDHVLQDLGTIPTLAQVIESISLANLKWLGGRGADVNMKNYKRHNEDKVKKNDEELFIDGSIDIRKQLEKEAETEEARIADISDETRARFSVD
jgi:hypothetical protein